jgi:PKD repeat protein
MTVSADFSYVINGLEVTCTDTSVVTDPSTPILYWYYSATVPGPNLIAYDQNSVLVFPSGGTFTITLDVQTDTEWSTIDKIITIADISFSAYPKSYDDTRTIVFTDLSSSVTSWNWDFGDGNTSIEQNPTHTYSTPGTYIVSLTSEGNGTTRTVIVTAPVSIALALANDGHIIKSVDKGLTWIDQGQKVSPYNLSTHGLDVSCGLINLGAGVVIAFSGNIYIERSTDYGSTWSTVGISTGYLIRAGISLGMGQGLLAGFMFDPTCATMLLGRIYKTYNYGLTWSLINTTLIWDKTFLAFTSFGNNKFILSLCAKLIGRCGPSSYSQASLMVSTNQGGVWEQVADPTIEYSLDTPNSVISTMLPEGQTIIPSTRTSLASYSSPYNGAFKSINPNMIFDRTFWSKSGKLFASTGEPEDTMEFTWRSTGVWPSNAYGQSIAFGNGIFIAVGLYSNIALRSTDGISWDSSNLLLATGWKDITFGAGVFVATGAYGITTSVDGISWAITFVGGSAMDNRGLTFGNGIFRVTGGGNVYISSNGYDWDYATEVIPANYILGRVGFGGGKFFTIGSFNGLDAPLTSINGYEWTGFNPTPKNLDGVYVTYGNGLYVAISNENDGYSTDVERVIISSDAETWTLQKLPETNTWENIFYGNGLFVAVSYYKTHNIATSPNGIDWTIRSGYGAYIYSGVYGNGLYVLFVHSRALANHYILTSPGPVVVSDPIPRLYSSSDRGETFDNILENHETWAFYEYFETGNPTPIIPLDFSEISILKPVLTNLRRSPYRKTNDTLEFKVETLHK